MELREKHFGDIREGERFPLLPNPAVGNGWDKDACDRWSRKPMVEGTLEWSGTPLLNSVGDSQLQGYSPELGCEMGHGTWATEDPGIPFRRA